MKKHLVTIMAALIGAGAVNAANETDNDQFQGECERSGYRQSQNSGRSMGMLGRLDLTEDQKAELETALAESKEAMKEKMTEIRDSLFAEISDLLTPEQLELLEESNNDGCKRLNLKALDLSEEQSEQVKEIFEAARVIMKEAREQQRADAAKILESILTPEQLELYEELRENATMNCLNNTEDKQERRNKRK